MRLAIRADAGLETGSGHVMRCLALAETLRQMGDAVEFVSRPLPGDAFELIVERGFHVRPLAADPPDPVQDAEQTLVALGRGRAWDWLVVDHYRLDASFEQRVRAACSGVAALDDLADRTHDCDVLVDQNDAGRSRYRDLVPGGCRLLCGPRYAILRGEFARERLRSGPRTGPVRRALIAFGGTDPTGETLKTLTALEPLAREGLGLDVIVGYGNPQREAILHRARGIPEVRVHVNTPDVARLMSAADLCVGAAGTTTWERCCVGLPTLMITVAGNQLGVARAACEAGAAELLGVAGSVSPSAIDTAVRALAGDPSRLRELSRAAWGLTDGHGARRVAEVLRAPAPA